jgi:flagellar basal body L-ring protein FlgH
LIVAEKEGVSMRYKIAVLASIAVIMIAVFTSGRTSWAEDSPEMQKVYPGMPKEELYQIYPVKYQIKHIANENREMIVFDDYLTNDPGDTVTFYVKDGKVAWWDKEKASPTPEERLNEVLNRSAHAKGGIPMAVSGQEAAIAGAKKQDLDNRRGYSNLKRLQKGY